jgi:protein-tyrosine phosphatase
LVCTANRCRSPLAAELLGRVLAASSVEAAVDSAGLGDSGFPVTDETAEVTGRRGLDVTSHRSQRVTRDLITDADLVLGMERLHVRDVVIAVPTAWGSTFTLKEFVRRAEAIGPRPAEEPLPTWIARVHAGRQRRDLQGASPLDDVADPTGGTLAEHEDMAREVEALVDRLVDAAWPEAERPEPSSAS